VSLKSDTFGVLPSKNFGILCSFIQKLINQTFNKWVSEFLESGGQSFSEINNINSAMTEIFPVNVGSNGKRQFIGRKRPKEIYKIHEKATEEEYTLNIQMFGGNEAKVKAKPSQSIISLKDSIINNIAFKNLNLDHDIMMFYGPKHLTSKNVTLEELGVENLDTLNFSKRNKTIDDDLEELDYDSVNDIDETDEDAYVHRSFVTMKEKKIKAEGDINFLVWKKQSYDNQLTWEVSFVDRIYIKDNWDPDDVNSYRVIFKWKGYAGFDDQPLINFGTEDGVMAIAGADLKGFRSKAAKMLITHFNINLTQK